MEPAFYIGHQRQLEHLAEAFGQRGGQRDPSARLYVLTGPKGAGKQTLVERLWQLLSNSEVPRVLFRLAEDGADNAERLMNGARSNRAYLGAVVAQVAAGVAAHAQRLADAGRPLPPEARLTVWGDQLEQLLFENERNNRDLQAIFVLPNLMELPLETREALTRQLPQDSPKVDIRYIITARQPVPPASLRILFPELTPEELTLPALTIDEVEQWARHKNLHADMAPLIYQKCGGLPGKLEAAAADVQEQMQEQVLLKTAEDALESLEPALARIVCQGALLPEISHESLLLFLPEDAAAQAARAIRDIGLPGSSWNGRAVEIEDGMRIALQKWLERNDPPLYRKNLGPSQEFAKIHAQIPEGGHRQVLARLSAYNYFNADLLHEVMGSIAGEVMRFVDAHGGYFEDSGSNLRIRPDLRPAVESYIRLVQHKNPDGEGARIAAAWTRKRQQVLDAMNRAEEHAKHESDSLAALQGQIRRLKSQIDGEEDSMEKLRRKAHKPRPQSQLQRRNGASASSLALQAVGTGILYVSILLSGRGSFVYGAAGVACILAGLFLQGRKLSPSRAAISSNGPQVDLSGYERNLHFLNLKRSQLEARQNQIAGSIAKDRAQMKEFDKQLREPYC